MDCRKRHSVHRELVVSALRIAETRLVSSSLRRASAGPVAAIGTGGRVGWRLFPAARHGPGRIDSKP